MARTEEVDRSELAVRSPDARRTRLPDHKISTMTNSWSAVEEEAEHDRTERGDRQPEAGKTDSMPTI